MTRISKAEIIKRFGKAATLWTDIVARNGQEAYHITAELSFDKTGKATWRHYIEPISSQATS